jgi:hypothetical protein
MRRTRGGAIEDRPVQAAIPAAIRTKARRDKAANPVDPADPDEAHGTRRSIRPNLGTRQSIQGHEAGRSDLIRSSMGHSSQPGATGALDADGAGEGAGPDQGRTGRRSMQTGISDRDQAETAQMGQGHGEPTRPRRRWRKRTTAARTGTGYGGRGDLAAAVTSRGSVGVGTLKLALIPC